MNTFKNIGFLSGLSKEFLTELEQKFSDKIDICEDLNRVAQKLQYTIKPIRTDATHMLSATLFARLLSNYQACLLLCSKGMESQVEMMLRCCIETLFPLVAISLDSSFTNRYIASDEHNRLLNIKQFIKFKTSKNELDADYDNAVTQQKEIQLSIKNIEKLTTSKCAEAANLSDWYQTLYCLNSMQIHSTVKSLESHLNINSANEIESLINQPTMHKLGDFYLAAAQALYKACEAIYVIFNLEPSNEFQHIKNTAI